MPKKLEIAELGHPVLRKKARPVKNINETTIQNLIDDLIFTAKEVNGVGIAAPQVFKSYQIFIIASYPNLRYPDAPLMEPTAIINPKIRSHSKRTIKDWEGCLSIPGIRGLVPRYKTVDVSYTNREGNRVEETYSDFIARIFQHEFDHLNGIVFLDRLESAKDIITDREYFKLIS